MSGSQNDFHLDGNDWYYHTTQYDDTGNFDSESTRPYAVHDVGDSSAQEPMPTGIHQPAPFGLINFQPRDQLNVDAPLYDYAQPYGTSGSSLGQLPPDSHTPDATVVDTWTFPEQEDRIKLEPTAGLPNASENPGTELAEGSKRPIKSRRRKKAYDPPDREKVALTRNVGACRICRTRRVSVCFPAIQTSICKADKFQCEFDIPCDNCIKTFGSASLTHGLCSRQNLRATRFNNVGKYTPRFLDCLTLIRPFQDLLRRKFFKAVIEEFESKPAARKYVGFSSPTCCGPDVVSFDMAAGYQNFEAGTSIDFGPQSFLCTFRDRFIIALPHRESYEPRPSLEVFFQRFSLSSHEGLTGPFSRLHKAFGEFAERYCASQIGVPKASQLPSKSTA